MKHFKSIIYIKSNALNDPALTFATRLAQHHNAKLHLVDIVAALPDFTFYGLPGPRMHEAEAKAVQHQKEELETIAQGIPDTIPTETDVLIGKSYIKIIKEVLTHKHDLIIKSAEGNEEPFWGLFNATDSHLLRLAPCPVWIINPEATPKIKNIIAAIDFDPLDHLGENLALNKSIMEKAFALAQQEHAQLHILHAWDNLNTATIPPYALDYIAPYMTDDITKDIEAARAKKLNDFMSEIKDWLGSSLYDAVAPKIHLVQGFPDQVILEQTTALKADLMIMGTVGRTGIPGFFIGNTAESILKSINCSVLTMKPEGFISPVTLG